MSSRSRKGTRENNGARYGTRIRRCFQIKILRPSPGGDVSVSGRIYLATERLVGQSTGRDSIGDCPLRAATGMSLGMSRPRASSTPRPAAHAGSLHCSSPPGSRRGRPVPLPRPLVEYPASKRRHCSQQHEDPQRGGHLRSHPFAGGGGQPGRRCRQSYDCIRAAARVESKRVSKVPASASQSMG